MCICFVSGISVCFHMRIKISGLLKNKDFPQVKIVSRVLLPCQICHNLDLRCVKLAKKNVNLQNYLRINLIDMFVPRCLIWWKSRMDKFIWNIWKSIYKYIYIHCKHGNFWRFGDEAPLIPDDFPLQKTAPFFCLPSRMEATASERPLKRQAAMAGHFCSNHVERYPPWN